MKKSIRKSLLLLSLSLGVACFAGGITACGGGNGSGSGNSGQPQASIQLSHEGIELDLYESLTLSYTLEGVSGEAVWTSSDESVATVVNGVVEAKKVGNATITVTVGKYSKTCPVRVYDSQTKPTIKLATDSIRVEKGATAATALQIVWKGNALENVTPTVELVDGANVANVTYTDGKLQIEGLEVGVSKWLVTAQTHGTTLAKEFTVECQNQALVFNVADAMPVANERYQWIAEIGFEGNAAVPTSYLPKVDVYKGGEKIATEADVTWSLDCEDGSIYAADGGYRADKMGNGELVGVYCENEIRIKIQPVRTEVVADEYITVELVDGLLVPGLNGNVESCVINGYETFAAYDVSTGETTLNPAGLSNPDLMGEDADIVITTDRAVYYYEGEVYTDIITTGEEFNAIHANAQKTANANKALGGYFVLGANIVCDTPCAAITYPYGTGASDGFKGVIDGRGYTVENFTTTGLLGGLMPKVGEGGVIKNIVFKNATVSGNSGLITSHCFGTLSNLYIEVTMNNNDTWLKNNNYLGDNRAYASVLTCQTDYKTVVNNCVIVYNNTSDENAFSGHPFIVKGGTVNGLYVIGHTTPWVYEIGYTYAETDTYLYESKTAMLADSAKWSEAAKTWDGNFWTTDKDGFPYPMYALNEDSTVVNPPELTKDNAEKRISWNEVDGAEYYEVYVDGKLVKKTAATEFDGEYLTASATISVKVNAKVGYVASETASEIGVTVIGNKWVDIAGDIQLSSIASADTNGVLLTFSGANWADGDIDVSELQLTDGAGNPVEISGVDYVSKDTVKITLASLSANQILSVPKNAVVIVDGIYYNLSESAQYILISDEWKALTSTKIDNISTHDGTVNNAGRFDVVLDGISTTGENASFVIAEVYVNGTEKLSSFHWTGLDVAGVFAFQVWKNEDGSSYSPVSGDRLLVKAGSVFTLSTGVYRITEDFEVLFEGSTGWYKTGYVIGEVTMRSDFRAENIILDAHGDEFVNAHGTEVATTFMTVTLQSAGGEEEVIACRVLTFTTDHNAFQLLGFKGSDYAAVQGDVITVKAGSIIPCVGNRGAYVFTEDLVIKYDLNAKNEVKWQIVK